MEFWDEDPFEMTTLLSTLLRPPQTIEEMEKEIEKDVEWLRFYEATLLRSRSCILERRNAAIVACMAKSKMALEKIFYITSGAI
ncbi:hypothetical protein AVEN_55140-1 [Araneus ventricosus]|uniref:Uncharacterized protein n=1 Tax=Araneus ventricosus TaxID=182803 RepID=A0A4Y2R3Z8_ARAVE|nr:hypothetical protein AVEN_55140-1 [Araneus ventricosus]